MNPKLSAIACDLSVLLLNVNANFIITYGSKRASSGSDHNGRKKRKDNHNRSKIGNVTKN